MNSSPGRARPFFLKEIFDAYRGEADRLDIARGPDQLAIRRNVSVGSSEAEARERSQMAMEATRKVLAGDARLHQQLPSLLDAPKPGPQSKSSVGFSVHADEFIAGTPAQVAEQIIAQCRHCGAGHFLAIVGRAIDEQRIRAVELFGEQVIPILRRAEIA